jgi:hypothetical protein
MHTLSIEIDDAALTIIIQPSIVTHNLIPARRLEGRSSLGRFSS